jgi:hypothetical protein
MILARPGLLGLCVFAMATLADRPTAVAAPDTAALLAAAVKPGPPRPALASPLPADRTEALRPEGVGRTSIERRFAGERVSGSLGFLCGRPDNLSGSGGAAVYGTDPRGRFLGARLSIALR